ncbi:MAG TPA: DNA-binding protein WhiA [Lachnospiraceae bacterium]
MSFSLEVKEELSRQIPKSRHCRLAELAGILLMCGQLMKNKNGKTYLSISFENEAVYRKCFTLLKKTFKIGIKLGEEEDISLEKRNAYRIDLEDDTEVSLLLEATKLKAVYYESMMVLSLATGLGLQHTCCKRAFLRGVFLSNGSISDPLKSYHFEVVCSMEEKAGIIRRVICDLDLDAKIVQRKKYRVVYLKESAQIVEVLAVMEANVALLNLENIRILKNMRNSLNRQVNCETANISKTVSAAVRQIEDIRFIKDNVGFSDMPDGLREVAELRLEYDDMPLKELGQMLDPPLGKSGVNHRLRKLSAIATELRDKRGGDLL